MTLLLIAGVLLVLGFALFWLANKILLAERRTIGGALAWVGLACLVVALATGLFGFGMVTSPYDRDNSQIYRIVEYLNPF